MKILNSFWVISLCFLCTNFANAQCYNGTPSMDYSSWNYGLSIEGNFNTARRTEEAEKGLTANCLGNMQAPIGGWGIYSAEYIAFYIHNSERTARGFLPLHGIESNLSSVAQAHSDWQMTNDVFSHTGNPTIGTSGAYLYTQCANCSVGIQGSSPFQRMNQNLPLSGQWESESENLGVLVSSGGFISSFVASTIYGFMYRDAGSLWGHRLNILQTFNDNWGSTGDEGFIGVGIALGNNYQICAFGCTNWNFGHHLTIDYYDPQPGASGYSFALEFLPVEWLSFNGELQGEKVYLDWGTAQEKNSAYFDVQRSADGRLFESIGQINAIGDSDIDQYYTFIDPFPLRGKQYYRLKEYSFDGQFQMSKIISISLGNNFSFDVYPNPFKESFLINGFNKSKEPVLVQVFDIHNRLVKEQWLMKEQDQVVSEVVISNLQSGVYTLLIKQGENSFSQLLVKEN